MAILINILIILLLQFVTTMLSSSLPIKILTRNEWGAKSPILIEHFNGPSQFVIIHHSYIPSACNTTEQCKLAMLSMQKFHQIDHGWNDIGYSFGIGGDGNIYEGRGFNVIGAHAPRYNDKSVGICLIGDWRTELPSEQMLEATHRLINWGIENNLIDKQYTLLGHRQVRDTECPGDRLFNEISKWSHFVPLIFTPPPPPPPPSITDITGPHELTSSNGQQNESTTLTTARLSLTTDSFASGSSSSSSSSNNESSRNNTNNSNNTNNLFLNNNTNDTNNNNNNNNNIDSVDENIIIINNNSIFNDNNNLTIPKS